MGCFPVWLRVWLVLWEGSRQEKIVLNLSLPFQSVCMFLFIILQFLSTYAIIKFPDPCLAALTRHWKIYSHCRSLSLMCSLSPSLLLPHLPPPLSLVSVPVSENLSLSHHLSPFLSFSESPWHCNGIRIINRVIVWNTLVCIEFLSLIFDAWLSGCWADSTPAPPPPFTSLPTILQTHNTCPRTHTSTVLDHTSLNGIICTRFPCARMQTDIHAVG